jgi:TetR/AcrR family transcriptional repressor of bet genes
MGVTLPKRVDHGGRRAEIAAALWRVVARDGIDAATVRNGAAEAAVSAGRVQHYFASRGAMLRFALQQVGELYGARLTERLAALPQPAGPRARVRTVLLARLPEDPEQRTYVQAQLAWLAQIPRDEELTRYLVEGTHRLRDHLAAQLALAQQAGDVPLTLDPTRAADGLLALTDGLISHVLQGFLDVTTAGAVIDEYLGVVFGAAQIT